jgi:hypothetical protein
MDINTIDNIKRTDIAGDAPTEAEYAALNPTGSFIEKFYKNAEVKFNDGTTKNILHYWGEQGGWHPSGFNSNPDALNQEKFLKIIS